MRDWTVKKPTNNLGERLGTQSTPKVATFIHKKFISRFCPRKACPSRGGHSEGSAGNYTPIPIPYIHVRLAISHADNHLFHFTVVLERFLSISLCPRCSTRPQLRLGFARSALIISEGDRSLPAQVVRETWTCSGIVDDLRDSDRNHCRYLTNHDWMAARNLCPSQRGPRSANRKPTTV